MCSFLVWKKACLNYREFDLEGDLVGVPHTWYLSAQSFFKLLKLVWIEYDIVAMNEWKKKCHVLQRTWVSIWVIQTLFSFSIRIKRLEAVGFSCWFKEKKHSVCKNAFPHYTFLFTSAILLHNVLFTLPVPIIWYYYHFYVRCYWCRHRNVPVNYTHTCDISRLI